VNPQLTKPPKGLIRFAGEGVATQRLYCLPFAGGGPSTYRLWPRTLPGTDVVAVVFPGRDPSERVAPADSIDAIVAAAATLIAELEAQAPLPFAIFGHSMGALVAFELTLAMEAADGIRPTQLFVSGRRPPDEPHQAAHIHQLDDAEFLDALQTRYGGVPEAVRNEPDLLALLLPSLRADIKAFETYDPPPGRRVTSPVRVYGGAQDRNPRPAQLGGWQRVVDGPISVRVFEGDHFYLTTARDELTADIAASR
jgi:surfactin synthase thioesterase subunit